MQPFVVTLCGLLIYRGVARGYTADAHRRLPLRLEYPGLDFFVGAASSASRSRLFVLVVVGGHRLVRAAPLGVRALPLRRSARTRRRRGFRASAPTVVVTAAYVICAGLTALAAIFFAMYTRSVQPARSGNFYELYAIAAAVLGGFSLRGGEGSIIGVILGTILLQVLQNLVNLLGIPSSLNFAVMGGVILVGVHRRPAMECVPGETACGRGGAGSAGSAGVGAGREAAPGARPLTPPSSSALGFIQSPFLQQRAAHLRVAAAERAVGFGEVAFAAGRVDEVVEALGRCRIERVAGVLEGAETVGSRTSLHR